MLDESGSIIPLGIAGLALSLVVSIIFLELTGVQLQTLRNKQISDVLALSVATDLRKDQIPPLIGLEYSPSQHALIGSTTKLVGVNPSRISVLSFDGKTIEASVCSRWQSITGFTFQSFGEVCSKSRARALS